MTTISELAGTLGLRADTLRYYERLGLLEPTRRNTAGYRLYDETAAERLRFIKGLQRMGLRLADIKELLDVRDRGLCPCGHTEVLVERRMAEVQAEIEELEAVRAQLLMLKRRNRECMDATAADWSCAITGRKEGGNDTLPTLWLHMRLPSLLLLRRSIDRRTRRPGGPRRSSVSRRGSVATSERSSCLSADSGLAAAPGRLPRTATSGLVCIVAASTI